MGKTGTPGEKTSLFRTCRLRREADAVYSPAPAREVGNLRITVMPTSLGLGGLSHNPAESVVFPRILCSRNASLNARKHRFPVLKTKFFPSQIYFRSSPFPLRDPDVIYTASIAQHPAQSHRTRQISLCGTAKHQSGYRPDLIDHLEQQL